jgi:hypothetical protein
MELTPEEEEEFFEAEEHRRLSTSLSRPPSTVAHLAPACVTMMVRWLGATPTSFQNFGWLL